ncbi:MAG: DUF2079 domain-containing protein [Anaerolineae bacterium]|nr:DUF2079 domain-containing protein [Anaerolineae bacterium]
MSQRLAASVVLALVLAYAAWFGYLAVLRHETLNSRGYDLGNVDQAIWNTAHGRILQFTNWIGKSEDFRYPSRLAMHFEPIYFLITPLYWLWSDVRLLLVLQAAVVASGAWAVYRLGLDELVHPWPAAMLAAAFLLYAPLQWALLDDFHAVTLVGGMIPFAFWALRRRRWGWFALLGLLIMATKEDMPLLMGMMGLYAFLWERQRAIGLGTMVAAAVWFTIAVFVVIPAYTLGGQSQYLGRYADVLGPGGLTLANLPMLLVAVVRGLLTWDTVRYLVGMLWPMAFLPLAGWPALLIAAPSVALNLLSNNPTQHVLGRHYVAPIAPVVAIAAVMGIATISRLLSAIDHPPSRIPGGSPLFHFARHATGILAALTLWTSLAAQWEYGFTPLARDYDPPQLTAHHRLLARFLAQIPPNASVSTQQNLNPHLSQREQITIIPYDVSGEYLLLDVTTYPGYNYLNIHAWLKSNVAERPGYGVVDAADGYVLLRRGAPVRPLPDAFYDFARVSSAAPQYPATVDFVRPDTREALIRFLGFDLLPRRDGEPFYVLYFQALQPLTHEYAVTLYLADERYQLRGATEVPQMTLVWYPTNRWRPGEIVRVVADTFTWWSGELSEFSVALGILDGTLASGRVDVWNVGLRLRPQVRESQLAPRLLGEGTLWHLMRYRNGPRRPTPLPEFRNRLSERIAHRVDARVGNVAQLLGYDVETPVVRPGGEVRITLYWQALAETALAYTVFVHLLDGNGTLRGQQDNPPVFGTQPLPLWRPGDHVRDPYAFSVALDAPPGRYDLKIGLYDPATGVRLPVTGLDGASWGDRILLEDVVHVR